LMSAAAEQGRRFLIHNTAGRNHCGFSSGGGQAAVVWLGDHCITATLNPLFGPAITIATRPLPFG
jgi:hypothetical protein